MIGLVFVIVGIVGAAVLAVMAAGRPAKAIDSFARAAVGCTTTLDFTETGTFHVYQERGGDLDEATSGCEPLSDPATSFGFEIVGPGGSTIAGFRDTTITYQRDGAVGSSVARVEIDVAGIYTIAVEGDDVTDVAAVGRDPDDGVATLWWAAGLVAVFGITVGVVLLVLGRRRPRAAAVSASEPPSGSWPPEPPTLRPPPIDSAMPPGGEP
jgi:hypothetical protein